MFIIFGTRGVTYTKGGGHFNCPECGAPREYKRKRVRRFFTLFFIPLIPLDLLGEYVECNECRGKFKMEVLSIEQSVRQSSRVVHLDSTTLKALILLQALRDGNMAPITEAESARLCELYYNTTGEGLAHNTLIAAFEQLKETPLHPTDLLKALHSQLSGKDKEQILELYYAGRREAPEVEEMLQELAQSMEMTEAHFKGFMDMRKA